MNIPGEGLYVGMQRITKALNSQDIIALQKFTGATLGNLLPSFFQEMINCTVQSKPFHSSDRWKNLNRDEKERLAGQILHWHRSLTFIEPSYERKCRYTVEDDQKLKIVFRGSDLKTPEDQTAYIEYLEEVKTDKINEGVDDDFLKWLKRKIENEKERLKPLNNNMGAERHLDSTGSNSNDFIFPGFIINILIDYHRKFDGWIFEEMNLDEFLNVFRQNVQPSTSTTPSGVSITPNNVCVGSTLSLSVTGGSLGSGSVWKWYTGECGQNYVGSGQSINVNPQSSTTYFVRAEGLCDMTDCVWSTAIIKTSSSPASSIIISEDNILPGTSVNLSVDGGSLGVGAQWKWYSGSCGGTYIGTGASITVNPNSTTTFFVRAENDCNISACVSTTVNTSNSIYSSGEQVINPATRNLNAALPVGTINGRFDVSNSGAATYIIPIFTAPGTAGMQPDISIVYNSHFTDGLLGTGWDIAGLSTIQRTGMDFYHDGKVKGVNLTLEDRFALDSNRLVIESGTYGYDGSIYRTEHETFIKVTAKGTAGSGPQWFEVLTKDGKTIEYGNSQSSRVEAFGSSTVYKWRINKIKDQFGNYIEFQYFENNGESYIEKIQYTGNETTSLTPYNTIWFSYETRTDVNASFVGGFRIPKTALLSSIRVESSGNTVREYRFKYALDFQTHLNEIIEYGKDHFHYNSTVVGWGLNATLFASSDVLTNTTSKIYYHGDFNGDGRTDFVVVPRKTIYTTNDTWQLWLASPTGTFSFKNQGNLNANFKGFYVADVDGNGTSDIYWKDIDLITYQCNPHPCGLELNMENSFEVSETDSMAVLQDSIAIDTTESDSSIFDPENYLLNPPPPGDTCWDDCYRYNISFLYFKYTESSGLVRGSSNSDFVYNDCPSDLTMHPLDLDGNGISDYLILDPVNDLFRIEGIYFLGDPIDFDNFKIVNFNGDGKQDILDLNSGKIYQYDPQNENFEIIYSSSTFPTTSDRVFTGDFNGDKKTDILYWNNDWGLKFSNGVGFSSSLNIPVLTDVDPFLSQTDNNIYIGDFNGDGKDDVLEVFIQGGGSILKVHFSVGDGIFSVDNNSYSKSSVNQDYLSFADIDGDGKKDLFYYDYSTATNPVNVGFFRKDEKKDLVACIANGLNYKTFISYSRINSGPELYTPGSNATFPVVDFNGPYYVVKHTESLPVEGLINLKTIYTYTGLRKHKQGKGFLGFQSITSGDNGRDSIYFRKEFSYHPDYYFTYLSSTSSWMKIGAYKFLENVNTYSALSYSGNRYYPVLNNTRSFNDFTKNTVTRFFSYDNYGNIIKDSTQFSSDGSTEASKTILNFYGQYGNYGIPNMADSSRSVSIYGEEPPYSRTVHFTHSANGSLLSEVNDPGTPNQSVKTYSQYNDYGLPGSITLSAPSLESRTTSFEYDEKSRFVTKITDPLSRFQTKTYDGKTGNVLTETGIDNNSTTYEYDGFGRLNKTILPQGNEININYSWDLDLIGGENSVYYSFISSTDPGRPYEKSFYDNEGRKLMMHKEGFGNLIKQFWNYSLSGSLLGSSLPYFQGEEVRTQNNHYDAIGRVITQIDDGLVTTYSYTGNETSITSPGEQVKKIKTNSLGDMIQVIENNNNIIDYSYGSNGQVKSISTAGTTLTFGYDDFGRKISTSDPNSGTSSFAYNAFGELVTQTDAKNNTSSFLYNVLGQPTRKTSNGNQITSFEYKDSGNGIGQIESTTGPDNIVKKYRYDSFGRVISVTDSIPNETVLTTMFRYNTWSDVSTIKYPSGIEITNVYDDKGYLSGILRGSESIWTLNQINGKGQPLRFSQGSRGLTTTFTYDDFDYLLSKTTGSNIQSYDFNETTGNLETRTYNGLSESFTYDNMDRLKTYYGGALNYDLNGNITTKTGTGTYQYDDTKKNAVTGITNNPGTISLSQEITYTLFNKTATVSQETDLLTFTYGPDESRIKSVLSGGGINARTTYYSPGYERITDASGTRELNYVSGPFGLVAILVKEDNDVATLFTEIDHLGSIIGLLTDDGRNIERHSFDAWGRRRNPYNWSYDDIPQSNITDRGFTGHEHLDKFGLINMNGRMYDPVLGRFCGVDPVIQLPDNSQSFNGYSYCVNNPLRYSDPTGFIHNRVAEMWEEYFGQSIYNTLLWEREQRENGGGGSYVMLVRVETKGGEIKDILVPYKSLLATANSGLMYNSSGKLVYSASGQGGITFEQAKLWYQFGGGARMDVNLNSIDLSRVRMSDFNSRGLATVRLAGKHFSNLNDALVHGTITLQRIGNTNQAKIALNSDPTTPQLNGQPAAMYDFEMHSWGKAINWVRNPETFIGGLINGLMPMPIMPGGFIYVGGTGFPIYYNGTVTIKP